MFPLLQRISSAVITETDSVREGEKDARTRKPPIRFILLYLL